MPPPQHLSDLSGLADVLGVPADRLAGLADCRPADVDRLAGLIGALLAAEDQAVEEGIDRTLAALPRPLRGRAATVLRGDGS